MARPSTRTKPTSDGGDQSDRPEEALLQDREMITHWNQLRKMPLLAGLLASGIVAAVAPAAAAPLNFNSVHSGRQATQLRRLWGIDDIHVRSTASGALVRFSYRVVDADKAKILNSKQSTPYLIDEEHGLALQIPVMDQVGQLRQVPTPQ